MKWECVSPRHTERTLNPRFQVPACLSGCRAAERRLRPSHTPGTDGSRDLTTKWSDRDLLCKSSELTQTRKEVSKRKKCLFFLKVGGKRGGSWHQKRGEQSDFTENKKSMHFALSYYFVFLQMLAPDLRFPHASF